MRCSNINCRNPRQGRLTAEDFYVRSESRKLTSECKECKRIKSAARNAVPEIKAQNRTRKIELDAERIRTGQAAPKRTKTVVGERIYKVCNNADTCCNPRQGALNAFDYYRNSRGDGKQTKCKMCMTRGVNEWKKENPEKKYQRKKRVAQGQPEPALMTSFLFGGLT